MQAVKERAYAKINLYLGVIDRREDGFHNVKTVMTSISLFDTVTVSAIASRTSSVSIKISGNDRLPTDARNLAVRAAWLFLERSGISAAVEIRLEKRIPVASGMAGGSTDAAAVLRALNRIFSRPFASRALHEMASELGSDVAYCLFGKTALCEGRGELITRLPASPRLFVAVGVANERVSTPMAYSALDRMYSDFGEWEGNRDEVISELLAALGRGSLPSRLYNIFEDAVLPECPRAAAIKKEMYSLFATHAMMSGSGPSIFGVFPNKEAADAAAERLRELGVNAFSAESID